MNTNRLIFKVLLSLMFFSGCDNTKNVNLATDKTNISINETNEISDYSFTTGYIPKEGFVPDKESAIKVAEAILVPLYGNRIYDQEPFNIRLKDNIWQIEGTLNEEYDVGGVFYIEIDKNTAEILKVIHSK